MSKTHNNILLSTRTLMSVADRINKILGENSLSKPVILNAFASVISGQKHNWGYLKGCDEMIVANGVKNPFKDDGMHGWIPIEDLPEDAGEILMIAQYPNSDTWSDVYHGWKLNEGGFARWTHPFGPHFYKPVQVPEGIGRVPTKTGGLDDFKKSPYYEHIHTAFVSVAEQDVDVLGYIDENNIISEQVSLAIQNAAAQWYEDQGPAALFDAKVAYDGVIHTITNPILDYSDHLLNEFKKLAT